MSACELSRGWIGSPFSVSLLSRATCFIGKESRIISLRFHVIIHDRSSYVQWDEWMIEVCVWCDQKSMKRRLTPLQKECKICMILRGKVLLLFIELCRSSFLWGVFCFLFFRILSFCFQELIESTDPSDTNDWCVQVWIAKCICLYLTHPTFRSAISHAAGIGTRRGWIVFCLTSFITKMDQRERECVFQCLEIDLLYHCLCVRKPTYFLVRRQKVFIEYWDNPTPRALLLRIWTIFWMHDWTTHTNLERLVWSLQGSA